MSTVVALKKKAVEFEQKRQFDKAIASYREVLDLYDAGGADNIDVGLYNRVADLLLRQGATPDAVSLYERAVDLYTEGGFFNNAIALCNKILRTSPGRASVYYKLGKISAAKGFKGDAKQNFLEYADRMQKSGMLQEAFRALKEFADLCPDQDDIRLLLADQLTKAGKKSEALEQLQLLYARYDADGRVTEAHATVERMKAIDPSAEAKSDTSRSKAKADDDLVFLDLNAPAAHVPRVSRSAPRVPTANEGLPLIDLGSNVQSEVIGAKEVPMAPLLGLEQTSLVNVTPVHLTALLPSVFAELDLSAIREVPTEPRPLMGRDLALPGELPKIGEIDPQEDVLLDFRMLDSDPVSTGERMALVGDGESFVPASPFALSSNIVRAEIAPVEPKAGSAILRPERERLVDGGPRGSGAVSGANVDANAKASAEPKPDSPDHSGQEKGIEASHISDFEARLEKSIEADPKTGIHENPETRIEGSSETGINAGPETGRESIPVRSERRKEEEAKDAVNGATDAEAKIEARGDVIGDARVEMEPKHNGSAETSDAASSSVPLTPGPLSLDTVAPPPRRGTSTALAASVGVLAARLIAEPEDWALHREYAEALFENGDRETGLKELEKALVGYERADDLDAARTVADEIIRLRPGSVRHHQKRVEYAFRSSDKTGLAEAYVALADALFRDGQAEKAKVVYSRVLEIAPADPRALAALETLSREDPAEPKRESIVPESASGGRPPGSAPSLPIAAPRTEATDDEGGYVSLGDWLRADEGPKSTRMVVEEHQPTGDEQKDFSDMLKKFKQGVAENVEEEDHASHYDLGVAYKEMGLIDEAIAQFQKAFRGKTHRVRTYEALGQCFLEKKQMQVAVTILQRALHEPGVGEEQLIGVLYLLGYINESLGRPAAAKEFYERVFGVDIEFRDVAQRLDMVEKALV